MKDDAKKEEPEVTPFAGVWIEIMMLPDPLVEWAHSLRGVWIEIAISISLSDIR